MTKIHYINHEQWGIDPVQFEPLVQRLHECMECWQGMVNVVFVNDVYIQGLNKNYREKDKPTDVLSFNYFEKNPKNEEEMIGEIYISVETAKSQAEENKETFEDELSKLFVHGFLHLHGHDHVEDEEYKVMHKLEVKVLERDLPLILNG